jgi:hypothetical protein
MSAEATSSSSRRKFMQGLAVGAAALPVGRFARARSRCCEDADKGAAAAEPALQATRDGAGIYFRRHCVRSGGRREER